MNRPSTYGLKYKENVFQFMSPHGEGEVGWRNNELLLLVNILGINKANLQSKVSKEGAYVKECMRTKRMGEFTATQKRETMDKAKG